MDSLRKLEDIFSHFPGIGPRQARRFVYYLLNKSPSFINEFTKLVEEVRKATSECDNCHRLFIGKNQEPNTKNQKGELICTICSDKSRDQSLLMVVARDSDFETVEKSGAYRGLYFILGGTVPLLDKEPEKRIRLRGLLERISALQSTKEVILSLNATPDGEHTADIVRDALQSILKDKTVKISLLGRGISTGAELEYVDGETIKSALMNRH
jgi:recombination protein RecR